MANPGLPLALQHMRNQLDVQDYSDVEVHVSGKVFALHRVVLSQSPYFKSAMSTAWQPVATAPSDVGAPHATSTSAAPSLTLTPPDVFDESPDALQAAFHLCLRHMYGYAVAGAINRANARAVLNVAAFLGLSPVCDAVAAFAFADLDDASCAFYVAAVHGLEFGSAGRIIMDSCTAYLLRNGHRMLDELPALPLPVLEAVLASPHLFVATEFDRALMLRSVHMSLCPPPGDEESQHAAAARDMCRRVLHHIRLEFLSFDQLRFLNTDAALFPPATASASPWKGLEFRSQQLAVGAAPGAGTTADTDTNVAVPAGGPVWRDFRFGTKMTRVLSDVPQGTIAAATAAEVSAPVHFAGSVWTLEARRHGDALSLYLRRTVCGSVACGVGCARCSLPPARHTPLCLPVPGSDATLPDLQATFSVRLCGAPGSAVVHSVVGQSRTPRAFRSSVDHDRWGWESFLHLSDVVAAPAGGHDHALHFMVSLGVQV